MLIIMDLACVVLNKEIMKKYTGLQCTVNTSEKV